MRSFSYKNMMADQLFGFSKSAPGQVVITDKCANGLALIQDFVEKILEEDNPAAFILSKTKWGGLNIVKRMPLSIFFKHINKMMDAYDPDLTYSAEVELFFMVGADCGWAHKVGIRPIDICPDGETIAEKYNTLISMIKNGLNSKRFIRKVQDRDWNRKRNHDSAIKYVNALFDYYARLLVIRIDLGYPYDPELHANTQLGVIQKDMKRFKRLMERHPIFGKMVGYIFKLEYGLSKGHHLHCIFFFDGSKAIKDSYIAQKIGELWKKSTEHRGVFHNCNLVKKSYKFLGIGMINYYDSEKRCNLGLALSYLFKAEQFLSYRYGKHDRTYFHGLLRKQKDKRLGRQRSIKNKE